MPTLYIIDGHAQFFRAYHAIRGVLTSPVTREPTNMTFGFVGMLLKLLKGDGTAIRRAGRPDYIAVVMDVSGDRGTFRSEMYPEYKAHRPEPPEDLRPQVDRCVRLLREIGVPVLGVEGVEADDVIATLVTRLRKERPDLNIRLVSKDKDLKQLLEEAEDESGNGREEAVGPVALVDIHADTVFDGASLKAEAGIRPSQVVDMLALMGDAVDNVPGVEGVGEKTAAALVREWGTLENLMANAGKVGGKRGEKIREALPRLGLSRDLVTLKRDVPVEFDLDAAKVERFRLERLIPILKELGFNRYQDEVRRMLARGGEAAESPAGGLFDSLERDRQSGRGRHAQSGTYHCVRTREELAALVEKLRAAAVVSVDTETTSLSPREARLCGISLCVEPGEAYYVPVRSPTPGEHLDEVTVLGMLRPVLEDPTKAKCGHNLKYDLLVLRNAGVELRGLDAEGSCDTMVASYLIDASRSSHALDSLALAVLKRTNIALSELIGSGKDQRTFDTVALESATQYAAEDADVALQLREVMMPQLRAMGLMPLMQDVEMPLVEVLADMEWNGIRVDAGELDRQRERLARQIELLRGRIDAESRAALGRTFDPDSPRQLGAALFNKPDDDPPGLGIPGGRRTKTGYSTDAEVLERLVEDDTVTTPIPELILEYRQLTKLVSTYLVALREAIHPKTGRVHASFHQTVAATGRLASSDPNLQNIPIRTEVGREIRRAFVAEPGCVLITADYSQIELRLLAHLSEDPALIEAFREGEDIHTAVAAQVFHVPPDKVTREQRGAAKMVNFGIVYGVTPYGLARRLKISQEEATAIIDGYKRRFAGITTFLHECVEQARRYGYVTTILGRRRTITDLDSKNPSRRALAERLSINSVVQGSAADLIKVAMVDLHRRFRDGTGEMEAGAVRMLLQIHDELVFEAPEEVGSLALETIRDRMEHAMGLRVPLKVDAALAKNWFEGT